MLSNEDIKEFIKAGRIKVEPRLKPNQISPGSIDLTLSDEFWVFKERVNGCSIWSPGCIVDLKKSKYTDLMKKVKAKKIEISPGQLVLGKTVEKITLANDVAGKLEGRSTYARMGLAIHVTSAMIQPGSSNRQVLEIVNLAPYKMVLHAGMRVSQAVFEEVRTPTSKPYKECGKVSVNQ